MIGPQREARQRASAGADGRRTQHRDDVVQGDDAVAPIGTNDDAVELALVQHAADLGERGCGIDADRDARKISDATLRDGSAAPLTTSVCEMIPSRCSFASVTRKWRTPARGGSGAPLRQAKFAPRWS